MNYDHHCLIYCCVSGKSLYKNYLSGKGEFVLAAKRNVLPRARVLNGTVCFSCDIGKVEETIAECNPQTRVPRTKSLNDVDFLSRSCLSIKDFFDYQPKHALYLENVKEIKPFKIWELVRRDPTGLNIAEGLANGMHRAPQNMCYGYRWNGMEWERVLVLSIQSKNLANIANGLKDIETRRQVVNEIKEMEK